MGRDVARLLVSPFPHSPVFLHNICDPLSRIDQCCKQYSTQMRQFPPAFKRGEGIGTLKPFHNTLATNISHMVRLEP